MPKVETWRYADLLIAYPPSFFLPAAIFGNTRLPDFPCPPVFCPETYFELGPARSIKHKACPHNYRCNINILQA